MSRYYPLRELTIDRDSTRRRRPFRFRSAYVKPVWGGLNSTEYVRALRESSYDGEEWSSSDGNSDGEDTGELDDLGKDGDDQSKTRYTDYFDESFVSRDGIHVNIAPRNTHWFEVEEDKVFELSNFDQDEFICAVGRPTLRMLTTTLSEHPCFEGVDRGSEEARCCAILGPPVDPGTCHARLFLGVSSSPYACSLVRLEKRLRGDYSRQDQSQLLPTPEICSPTCLDVLEISSPSCREIAAVARSDSIVVVFDISASDPLFRIADPPSKASLKWMRWPRVEIVVGGYGSNSPVHIYDLMTEGELSRNVDVKQNVTALDVEENERTLIIATDDGCIGVWDLEGNECVGKLPLPRGEIGSTVTCPQNEDLFYVGTQTGEIDILDRRNMGAVVEFLRPHGSLIPAIVPISRVQLVSGSVDGDIKSWTSRGILKLSTASVSRHPGLYDLGHYSESKGTECLNLRIQLSQRFSLVESFQRGVHICLFGREILVPSILVRCLLA